MPYGFLLVALGYVLFAGATYLFEFCRTRANGIDLVSLFVALFALQCCFSVTAIFALLPFMNPGNLTGVFAFDHILGQLDVPTALLVLCLTAFFLVSFYLGCHLGKRALAKLCSPTTDVFFITVGKYRVSLILVAGMALTLYSFMQLADTMVGRYANLVLLRADDPQVERNALNANAFALTESWSWLSIVAVFCAWESRHRRILFPIFVVAALIFAVLGVSRRALFLPIVMAYLVSALYSNKWRVHWIAAAAVPLIIWVAFGKNLLAAVAYDGSLDAVAATYDTWKSAVVRAACDIGITVVESLGTVQFIDLPPRLGSDHILSMIKLFPERILGFDIDYPERIVRISTAALDGPNELDLPPGLMGQMWLDFRLAGPIVWGIILGLQVSVVQWLFERTRCTRQSAAVFVLLVFIIALPLNTGSFDFTFSVDIVGIVVALLLCLRVSRGRFVTAQRIHGAG